MVRRHPLTRAQAEVWLAHHTYPDPSVLGVPLLVDIPARLDPDALRRAIQAVVDESDALRTTIEEASGEAFALVHDRVDAAVEILHADDPDEANALVAARPRRAFQLDRVLFDAAIVTTGRPRTLLYLNQHHVVSDGRSAQRAAERIAELYAHLATGRDVPPPPPSFAEYVEAARALDDADRAAAAERFWARRLTPPVAWPALYHRLPHTHADVFRITERIGPDASAAIARAAGRASDGRRSPRRPVLAVMAACLAAYEWRVGGASRAAIGIPFHNRPPRFHDTLGLFVSVVPLVVDVDPDEPAHALIARVLTDLEAAFAHASHPVRHSWAAPAYHTLLNHRPVAPVAFGDVQAMPRLLFTGHLDAAMGVAVQQDASGEIVLDFDWHGDVFDAGRARRAIAHLLAVVDAIAADPAIPIGAIDLVSTEERTALRAWNTATAPEPPPSIVDLILGHAADRPDACAIEDGAARTSYAELAARARALAARLRQAGVEREVTVGIALERSPAALISMLAALCAGGAWVPVDPAWPDDRLAFVLADAGARAIVTASGHAARVRRLHPAAAIVEVEDQSRPAGDAPDASRDPHDLAYVLYTSGSTGQPKGVAVETRALANHAAACARLFGLGPEDRVLQFRSLVFDGSIEEVFPTWVAGAALVLRPDALASDLERFVPFVRDRRITVLELPTAYWHEWVHTLSRTGAAVPGGVRLLAIGGEQPSAAAWARWRALASPNVRLLNMYGPTETTVTAACFEADAGLARDPVPIGRPFPNARLYVLDERQRPVPIEVAGELYIGGAGVARGYVNQPALTAERFVPDPFEGGRHRMYRTGDRARVRADGLVEYLGRFDDQVKIRGYRIEVGEVEQALAHHPSIEQAVVAAVAGVDADTRRLVAYLVPRAPIEDAALRRFLRSSLPEYMLPQLFVRLDRLPLTAGGKVDRRALPDPAAAPVRRAADVESRRPDEIEQRMIAVWERVLGTTAIQTSDSFVDLGGHSLLAGRLVHEVAQAFDADLPLSIMFPDVTVRQLAEAVRDRATPAVTTPIWTAGAGGTRPPFVFFHGQYGGGGLYAARLERLLPPEQPLVVVHPHGLERVDIPPTIEEMARDRVGRIAACVPIGPVAIGGYCNGALVAYETAHALAARGYRVLSVVLIDPPVGALGRERVARAAARYARWRRLGPAAARDLFLRWRARADALDGLLGRGADPRFVSLADRAGFVAASLVRRLRRTRRDSQPAIPSGVSRTEALWRAYGVATAAYAPRPFRGRVILVLAGDRDAAQTAALWRRAAPQLTVARIGADHQALVTQHLDAIAGVIQDAATPAVPQDPRPPVEPLF